MDLDEGDAFKKTNGNEFTPKGCGLKFRFLCFAFENDFEFFDSEILGSKTNFFRNFSVQPGCFITLFLSVFSTENLPTRTVQETGLHGNLPIRGNSPKTDSDRNGGRPRDPGETPFFFRGTPGARLPVPARLIARFTRSMYLPFIRFFCQKRCASGTLFGKISNFVHVFKSPKRDNFPKVFFGGHKIFCNFFRARIQ